MVTLFMSLLRHVKNLINVSTDGFSWPCVHNFKAALLALVATQGFLSATTCHCHAFATYYNFFFLPSNCHLGITTLQKAKENVKVKLNPFTWTSQSFLLGRNSKQCTKLLTSKCFHSLHIYFSEYKDYH